jgi:hypothetical protein
MLNFLLLETAPDSLSLCTVCPPPLLPPLPATADPPPPASCFPSPQNTHWSSVQRQKVERGLLLLIHILWVAWTIGPFQSATGGGGLLTTSASCSQRSFLYFSTFSAQVRVTTMTQRIFYKFWKERQHVVVIE